MCVYFSLLLTAGGNDGKVEKNSIYSKILWHFATIWKNFKNWPKKFPRRANWNFVWDSNTPKCVTNPHTIFQNSPTSMSQGFLRKEKPQCIHYRLSMKYIFQIFSHMQKWNFDFEKSPRPNPWAYLIQICHKVALGCCESTFQIWVDSNQRHPSYPIFRKICRIFSKFLNFAYIKIFRVGSFHFSKIKIIFQATTSVHSLLERSWRVECNHLGPYIEKVKGGPCSPRNVCAKFVTFQFRTFSK